MTQTFDFSTETQARAFWHHLCDQMGLGRMMERCTIKLEGETYYITVTHE